MLYIGISDTDKTDNLTCDIIYDNLTCENYRFSNNHLEIPDLLLVLNMISHSFAALTREISRSTLEINLVFPRTQCIILYINYTK